MDKPYVKDSRLSLIVDDLYRANASVGSGSTADAVRYEIATGQPVGRVYHSQKARDYSAALENWLIKYPKAAPGDRAAAENILRDMRNALRGE